MVLVKVAAFIGLKKLLDVEAFVIEDQEERLFLL